MRMCQPYVRLFERLIERRDWTAGGYVQQKPARLIAYAPDTLGSHKLSLTGHSLV
jgi:hypothetical protein